MISISNKNIKLQIWDTVSQAIYLSRCANSCVSSSKAPPSITARLMYVGAQSFTQRKAAMLMTMIRCEFVGGNINFIWSKLKIFLLGRPGIIQVDHTLILSVGSWGSHSLRHYQVLFNNSNCCTPGRPTGSKLLEIRFNREWAETKMIQIKKVIPYHFDL